MNPYKSGKRQSRITRPDWSKHLPSSSQELTYHHEEETRSEAKNITANASRKTGENRKVLSGIIDRKIGQKEKLQSSSGCDRRTD